MRTSSLRAVLSCLLIFVLPASMFAADAGAAAMLYTNGTAWLNGNNIPKSPAIFSGDLVQTRSDSAANIKAPVSWTSNSVHEVAAGAKAST